MSSSRRGCATRILQDTIKYCICCCPVSRSFCAIAFTCPDHLMAESTKEKLDNVPDAQLPPAYPDENTKAPLSPSSQPQDGQSSKSEDFPVKLHLRRAFLKPSKRRKTLEKTDVLLLSIDTTYNELRRLIMRRCQALFDLPETTSTSALNLTTGTDAQRYGDIINFNEQNCRAALMLLKRREEKGNSPCLTFEFYWTPPEERKENVLKKTPAEEKAGQQESEKKVEPASNGLRGLLRKWAS